MTEYNNKSFPEQYIDKDYCNEYGIEAEWFKLDKTTAECLLALVEETTDDKGNLVLKDSACLSYSTYAILKYFVDGKISPDLQKIMQRKDMKLGRLAYKHCIDEVEKSRVKVAKYRLNGQKGGRARASGEKTNC